MDGDMTTLELHTGSLQMNELAPEIADGLAEQTEALRVRLPPAQRRAGHRCRRGDRWRLRRRARAGGDLHGRAGQRDVTLRCRSAASRGPGVTVWTDHPAVSCMASQYAGWAISVGKFFAMGSGPLRAHARVERELFEKLGYEEEADEGVLVLEGRTLPTDEVAAWVAEKARFSRRNSRS